MYFLIIIIHLLGMSAGQLDTLQNKFKFGYGVNFKYNGKLYHNLDREWAVHRLPLPSVQQLDNLPEFPQELNCVLPIEEHRIPLTNTVKSKKNFIQTFCQTTIPQFKLLQKQAGFYRTLAKNLLQHDLYHALHGLSPVTESRYKKRALTTHQALLVNVTYPTQSRFPNRKKRFITAVASVLLPAAGKLVTLAVKSLVAIYKEKETRL